MKKLLDEIKRVNVSKKIKIRLNLLPAGHSIYLEYNKDYKRERIFLNMKLSDSKRMTRNDEDILYKAEIIRDTRELELFGNSINFVFQIKLLDIDFIDYSKKIAEEKNLPSYKACIVQLKSFLKTQYFTTSIKFADIDTIFCQKFKDYLSQKIANHELANQTAKTYLSVFSATLNKAFNDKLIKANPAARIRIKSIDAKREFLTEEELKQIMLVDTPHTEIQSAFLFASQTSLRLGDIRSLTFSDIRIHENNEAFLYFRQRKTKGVSHIKLSKLAYDIYLKQKEAHPESEFVFDLPKSRTCINDKLREIAPEAGITKHIHFHVSRHSWATLALSKGVDIYTVSKIMGHSSVAITEIYANLINKKRDEVADIMNLEITKADRDRKKKIRKANMEKEKLENN